MEKLREKKCIACEGAVKPLDREEIKKYLKEIKDWKVIENKKIEKEFEFENFREALAFVNKVGEIAEEERHHPDIYLHNWNKVKITLYTHAINGLFINDFILAAKIDDLF